MVARSDNDLAHHLADIYRIYAGAFAALVILIAILEQMGIPNRILGFLLIAFTLIVYAGIGIFARTMRVTDYFVAGRQIPPGFGGMASAANWLSGTLFLALGGSLFALGQDGLAYIIGLSGGLVLVAVLIAPYLRKFGAFTVSDFLAARFGGSAVRLLGVVILFAASFLIFAAQMRGTGLIIERFMGVPAQGAVFIGFLTVLLGAVLGGMRAVTLNQIGQYIVLIVAYLIPVAFLSLKFTGLPLPQLMYGSALQQIAEFERDLGISGALAKAAGSAGINLHASPFANMGVGNYLALIICTVAGSAALPHLLMHTFTGESVRSTRRAVGWSCLFAGLLLITAPAYAVFVKLEIYQNVIGQTFADLPQWIFSWGAAGGITICGEPASSVTALQHACAGKTLVAPADFRISHDLVVTAAPDMFGLPFVVTALLGAGLLAALISTASGLLLTMSSAVSHDLFHKILDRTAPTSRRLVLSRFFVIIIAAAGAFTALSGPRDMMTLLAWSFSLAAAGLFPALCLGIWWKGCTSLGALAGMASGFAITLFYVVWTADAPLGLAMPAWLGIGTAAAGIFGLPVGFLVAYLVSRITPKPSEEVQHLVDEIRTPRGPTVVDVQIGGKRPQSW